MAVAEISLFNEEPIYCLRPKEATYLAGEVSGYLMHGITVKPGDTVFDVGANIGMFSLWVCRLCQNELMVYAFEPIPSLVAVLELNARRFAPDQLRVMPFGLSHSRHEATFTHYPNATVWSTAYPALAYQERGQTKLATLKSLETAPRWVRWIPVGVWSVLIDFVLNLVMRKTQTVVCSLRTVSDVIDEQQIAQIDLLKVDVEHGELDVLMGISSAHWVRIQKVVMEVHAIDNRLEEIRALLREHGFVHIITDQQGVLTGTTIFMLYATR